MDDPSPLLRMSGIHKSFPGVTALEDVDFELEGGEVHGLVGENGAGKTTLMNILNGVLPPDRGRVLIQGEEVRFDTPLEAQARGIAYIHQELNLVEELTVKQNLFLGREPLTTLGTLDRDTLNRKSRRVLSSLDLEIDPDEPVENLSLARKQMVEITKALLVEARMFVMDEPTSSLTSGEIEVLFDLIRRLRDDGAGIVYISHRMEEIFEITDRVTVLRDGRYIGTRSTGETDHDQLVRMMAGKDVGERFFKQSIGGGETILEVKNLRGKQKVQDVSFSLRRGEILGFAGLMGAGRTELLETLFGIHAPRGGEMRLNGNPYTPTNSHQAIQNGLAYLPEDRELKGLFLDFDLLRNISLSRIEKEEILVDERKHAGPIERLIDELEIVTPSARERVRNLSGGNRQKVILARWMYLGMDVLLINEPTRGIDVGTKTQIYRLLYELNQQDVAVCMVSSELPEVLAVSDRVIVMHEGRVNGTFTREDATKERLLRAMTGQPPGAETGGATP